jgi:hypothetical protein
MKLRHAAALARMPLMSGITRWLQREAEMAGWYRLYLTAILWAPILLMLLLIGAIWLARGIGIY